jgi:hypothetical protein
MKLANLQGQNHVTNDEIKRTDEFKALIKEAYEETALLACRLVLRGSFLNVNEALVQILTQLTVFGAFNRLANNDVEMTWVPSGPAGNNAFVRFITGKSPGFKFQAKTTVNCWEVILLAGMLDGRVLNPARLVEFYNSSPRQFEANLINALMQQVIPYNPATSSGRPLPGDIVMFDGLGHVTMATGQLTQGPIVDVRNPIGARIISFWPAPATNNFGPDTKTRVNFTTIEAILDWYQQHMPTQPTVTFGAPNWRLLGN